MFVAVLSYKLKFAWFDKMVSVTNLPLTVLATACDCYKWARFLSSEPVLVGTIANTKNPEAVSSLLTL